MRNAIRTGDYVEFTLPVFSGGSFFQGRFKGARKVGEKHYAGTVCKHSYGEKTGQHTFTVLLADGGKKLVKGRNLYPNVTKHVVDWNSCDRKGELLAAYRAEAERRGLKEV